MELRDPAKTDHRYSRDSSSSPSDTAAKALRGAVDVIAGFVADFDPGRYSGADAASLVDVFIRAERLCGAGKTLAAARVAESNRPAEDGHRSAAHWLAGVTGESIGEAIDLLRLGEALEDHPGVDEAYRQGRLSRSRVKLVAGAVRVNPRSEDEVLQGAESDTLRQLKDRCLRAKAQGRSGPDALRAYEAIRKSRYCRTWTDTDGAFRLDAKLTPDAGAGVLGSLASESNRCFERSRKSGIHEPRDAYCADALVSLVTGHGIHSGEPQGDGPDARGGVDRGPNMASHADSDERPNGIKATSVRRVPDPKAVVHVRVDLNALRGGSLGTGEVCEIPGVGPVPIETARALMGDAITKLVVTNGVDVTTICNLGRYIPAPLKTALLERDQTCVVPGCDVAQGLEFDHWGRAFIEGGPVSLKNLARLCGHHHYLRTHKGFQLSGGPGRWRWDQPPSRGPRSSPGSPADDGQTEGSSMASNPIGTFDTPLFTIEE